MPRPQICAALAMIVMMAATPAFADDQHHPGATAPAAKPAAPGTAQQGSQPGGMPSMGAPGTQTMPMMGMGRESGMSGMPMMQMMRSMMGEGGMMGSMPMMAGRAEGRIALSQSRAQDYRGAAAAVERGRRCPACECQDRHGHDGGHGHGGKAARPVGHTGKDAEHAA